MDTVVANHHGHVMEAASISRLSISEHRFEHRAYLTVSINLLRFIARTGY
jgi:hypothetical protein